MLGSFSLKLLQKRNLFNEILWGSCSVILFSEEAPLQWFCLMCRSSMVTQICCDSYVQFKPGIHSVCCGSLAYDVNTQLCCEGLPVRKVGNHSACCGRMAYDVQNQLCCENRVVPKPSPYSACCPAEHYPTSYNTVTQLCCAGFVYPASPGVRCCGAMMYHTRMNMCCDGSLILPILVTGCRGFA